MNSSLWKVVLAAVAVGVAGCDVEDRIRSVLYDDADSVVPITEDEEETVQRRSIEPGEHPDRATPLEIGEEMEPVFAEIDDAGQTHWFSVQRQGGEDWMVDLTVEPRDSDLDVVLHLEVDEEDHAPLRYDIAGAGEPEDIPMLKVPADGDVQRFSISGADDTTGSYRIDLRRRLSAANVAMVPSDVPAMATELEVPGEVQGFYDRPHDRDVFFVPAESLRAGIYSLEVSAVPGLEQNLRIYGDEQLETPLIAIDVSEDIPAVIPNLSLDAREGDEEGLYFTLSARGDGYDREHGYRLRLIEHPDTDEDGFAVEREPNDTASTAQPVEFGEPVRGYFHTPNDVDRFKFVIGDPESDDESGDESEESADQQEDDEAESEDEDHRPEALRRMLAEQQQFEEDDDLEDLREAGYEFVDPWEGIEEKEGHDYVVQARLRPLGDAHRMAMRWFPEPDAGASTEVVADDVDQSLVVCNRVVGAGEYQIEVRSDHSETGFRPRSYDYELEVVNIAAKPGLEVEPNDELHQADRLEQGERRVGFIDTDGDVDVFAFVVGSDEPSLIESADDEEQEADENESVWEQPETEQVQVSLEGNPLNLQFELLDDEGARVARVNEGGPGADEQLQIDLPHGLYYVAVRADSGSVCEPYYIEVTTH